eukprot:Nk52_evm65s1810 gene=Nk52_evmTU65s1810
MHFGIIFKSASSRILPSRGILRRSASREPLAATFCGPIVREKSTSSSSSPSQEESKTPSDSFINVLYPFRSSRGLRQQYTNHYGDLRVGKLFESMDALAAAAFFKHLGMNWLDGDKSNIGAVTASVDHISCQPLTTDGDLLLHGFLIWTGKSSAKVRVEILQAEEKTKATENGLKMEKSFKPLLDGLFTMVALDKTTGKGARIRSIIPETEQEKIWFETCQRRHDRRKLAPEIEENESNSVVEDTETDSHVSQCKLVPIFDTAMDSNILMFPQSRNIHNKIFGGYLMRKSFELAFMSAVKHSGGKRPRFVSSADINFIEPVDIGDILNLKSFISYATETHTHVSVVANVLKPGSEHVSTTNTFHYTFELKLGFSVIPTNTQEEKVYQESRLRNAKQRKTSLARKGDVVPDEFKFYMNDIVAKPPFILESPAQVKIMEPFPLDILEPTYDGTL